MTESINAMYVNIDELVPNNSQPRKYFNENYLNELAQSIKTHGIINPITVRKFADKYEIVAGERRFRAAKIAGLTKVPVIIKNITDEEMSEIALIENLQRQEFTPIEEANSYDKLLSTDENTTNILSEKLGKSPNNIANKIKLLSLAPEIKNALANEKISESHARSLAKMEDPKKQIELLERIMREKLTVKETEQIIEQNEMTDEDLQNAIDNIMKSLNLKSDDNNITENLSDEDIDDEDSEEDDLEDDDDETEEDEDDEEYDYSEEDFYEEEDDDSENSIEIDNNEEQEENIEINETNKEEKKEDDNMNNGNFFTNYDNNMMSNQGTMGMNLNNNIMQSPVPVEQETVLPTQMQNTQQEFQQPMQEPAYYQQGDLGVTNQPVPQFNYDNQIPVQQEMVESTPVVNQQVNMTNEVSSIPMVDEPLFNPNAQIPTFSPTLDVEQPVQPNTDFTPVEPMQVPEFNPIQEDYSIPEPAPIPAPQQITEMGYNNQPMSTENVQVDEFTRIQNVLMQNGINYKSYINETGHCIIIEV